MFTARYGLSPYITKIRLVFERLTEARNRLWTKQIYQYRLQYIQGNITRYLMMSDPKDQYGFVRLDRPSLDGYSRLLTQNSIKEILYALAVTPSHHLSITLRCLSNVVT